MNTNINRHATPEEIEQALKRVAELDFDSAQKTPEQGANSSVFTAVKRDLPPVDTRTSEVKGVYLADCKVDNDNISAFVKNRAFAEKLWKLSEGLVNRKFEFLNQQSLLVTKHVREARILSYRLHNLFVDRPE